MHPSLAPNSLFAIRYSHFFAPSRPSRRMPLATLLGNLPKIANRARAPRLSETAPRPRQPNIANRGVHTLAMLATFTCRPRRTRPVGRPCRRIRPNAYG